MLPGNAEAIQAWNTILFDKFTKYRHLLVDAMSVHSNRALDLYPPKGATVDIGCGFGDTAIEIGRRVGSAGRVVGVDAASNFIEESRKAAAAAGASNVSFEVADVEEAVPGGPYDHAFSRFGVMFFNSPVFALRNIRKTLAPGAKLCAIVWRKKEANEAFYGAELIAREVLGTPPKGDQITCGPGPFSMSSPDVVSDQLLAAGFRDPVFARQDLPLMTGRSVEEAVEIAMTLGPAGEVIRLAGDEGKRRWDEIAAAMRAMMVQFTRPDGVYAPSTTWIVTATAP
jgi:SAM-dependent methyltransferase